MPMLAKKIIGVYDTYMRATAPAALVKAVRHLVLLTADYAFGAALERDTTASCEVGAARAWYRQAPPKFVRILSFLLQAQASKAKRS